MICCDTYVTTWVNLKNIMLSERSQAHKDYILHDTVYIKSLKKAKL